MKYTDVDKFIDLNIRCYFRACFLLNDAAGEENESRGLSSRAESQNRRLFVCTCCSYECVGVCLAPPPRQRFTDRGLQPGSVTKHRRRRRRSCFNLASVSFLDGCRFISRRCSSTRICSRVRANLFHPAAFPPVSRIRALLYFRFFFLFSPLIDLNEQVIPSIFKAFTVRTDSVCDVVISW